MNEKLKSLYIDMPAWDDEVKVDDFLITIGVKQSNSVYHVAEVKRVVEHREKGFTRYYVGVLMSDLLTAIKRDSTQQIIPLHWYPRSKKDSNN